MQTIYSLTTQWSSVAASGQTVIVQNLSSANVVLSTSTSGTPSSDGIVLTTYADRFAYTLTAALYARAIRGTATIVVMDGISLATGGGTSPTLGTITLSSTTAVPGSPYTGTISGKTAGSTVPLTFSDGTVLTISGTTVTGTFATAGNPIVIPVETLAGATNSPHSSPAITFTVAAAGGGGGTLDFSQAANSALLAALAA